MRLLSKCARAHETGFAKPVLVKHAWSSFSIYPSLRTSFVTDCPSFAGNSFTSLTETSCLHRLTPFPRIRVSTIADPGRARTRASRHTKPSHHRTVAGRRLTCKSRVPHTRRAVLTGRKNPENARKRGREREQTDIGSGRRERSSHSSEDVRYGVI